MGVALLAMTEKYKTIVKLTSFATLGYIVMLRARMFRSLIPVLMIKEQSIRARNITI